MKGMKRALMAVVLVVGLMGFIGQGFVLPADVYAGDEKPKLSVSPKVSTMGKKMSLDIMGTGFDPKVEIRLLFTDAGGMQSDVGYALKPYPKPNDDGAWITTWEMDRFIRAKVVQPGAFTVTATDSEFKPLAKTTVFFKAAAKKKAKKDAKKKK